MNTIELIKNRFSFLAVKDFKCKVMRKNTEIDFVFLKDDLRLELFIESYSESLDVVVSNGKERTNILDFPFVDKNKISIIRQALSAPGLQNKIIAISQFVNDNLHEIFNVGS